MSEVWPDAENRTFRAGGQEADFPNVSAGWDADLAN
jgi:hypothetical protein